MNDVPDDHEADEYHAVDDESREPWAREAGDGVEAMRSWLRNLPPPLAKYYQDLKRMDPKGEPRASVDADDEPNAADAVLRLLDENKRLKARLLEEMAKTDPVARAIVNAPVVAGKITDEEREEVAAADGPWIPREQVMAELRARRESAPSDDDEPSVGDVHGYGGEK